MNQILHHHFDRCTVGQCERLFFLNKQFNDVAARQAKMEGTVKHLTVNKQPLSLDEQNAGAPHIKLGPHLAIERTTAFTSHRPIKSTLRRYFSPPDVKFTETLRYNTDAHQGTISIVPNLDVCTVQGNIQLREADGGVDRELNLDVKMHKRWFFIAWIAEKYILKSVASSYSEIHGLTETWLKQQPSE